MGEGLLTKQASSWKVDHPLAKISASGEPLETLNATVDFESFRPILERAAGSPRSPEGGWPSLDVALKFRMLVLQSLHGLSLKALLRGGHRQYSPGGEHAVDFREALIKAGALLQELDTAIDQAGFIPHVVQIIPLGTSLRDALPSSGRKP